MKASRGITLLVALGLSASAALASAQSSSAQLFRAQVQPNMVIIAPSTDAVITLNSAETTSFPPQQWTVRTNARRGSTVAFSTQTAFTHQTDSSFKQDARLDLSISSANGGANWTVVVASDQTNYAAADEIATVQARGEKPGRAVFQLGVTFLTGPADTLSEGDYEITVTGTVTAN